MAQGGKVFQHIGAVARPHQATARQKDYIIEQRKYIITGLVN